MNLAMIRAWILISVPETIGDLADLIGRADGLNKAIPEHAELADGLGWLKAAGLIVVECERYRRTAEGQCLVNRLRNSTKNTMELWDRLADALRHQEVSSYVPLRLSEQEVDAANIEWSRRFSKIYQELREKDS